MELETATPAIAESVTLTNKQIQLTVRPDLGGRIDQLQDCLTGEQWLWHPENYDPVQTRNLAIGASFDQHWTGGWDEIFPNDAAGDFRGRSLVDHGELWSQRWTILNQSSLGIQMACECQTVPVRVEKTIQLHPTEPQAELTYRFQNHSPATIPFLFKHHAAIAIAPGDQILLPDCQIEPAVLEFSKLIGCQQVTRFPKAFAADGQEIDLRFTPPRSPHLQEFYYSFDLAEGYCGIRKPGNRSLVMRFEPSDFPYVWVFQSYGGWHDHYVLVLEPATTMPYDLEIACRQGTIAQLPPLAEQTRCLTVTLERSG